MGYSKANKAQSRERILTNASKRIREAGLDGVSVGELMKAANLTHGGFYGHFDSRAGLLSAALDRALSDGESAASSAERGKSARTVKSIVNGYLSAFHRDNPGAGCAVAALAGDVARADPEVRSIMADKLDRYLGSMSAAFGNDPESEEFATAAWATMVGAIILSRVFADGPKSDQILAHSRSAILKLEECLHDKHDPAD